MSNTTVNETDTLELLCDVSESSPTPTVIWYSPEGSQVATTADLRVTDIMRDQAGVYTCQITQMGAVLSANVTVTVQCK